MSAELAPNEYLLPNKEDGINPCCEPDAEIVHLKDIRRQSAERNFREAQIGMIAAKDWTEKAEWTDKYLRAIGPSEDY